MGFYKNCSTNEYMNEFVLHSKRLNIKNGKLKKEILKNYKLNGYLKIFSLS